MLMGIMLAFYDRQYVAFCGTKKEKHLSIKMKRKSIDKCQTCKTDFTYQLALGIINLHHTLYFIITT